MFNQLSENLIQAFKTLTGQNVLNERNIKPLLGEVRTALLEADVALSVVERFIERVEEKISGATIPRHMKPETFMAKMMHDALVATMGTSCANLNLLTQPPAVILVAGLQGAGKTTTVGKLSYWLKNVQKKSVVVVSTDVYRPAAIDQLRTVAENAEVYFHPSHSNQKPKEIVQSVLTEAKKQFVDVVLIDTAGRLHIDNAMMQEIQMIHKLANPIETLFVVDSMTGQDAVHAAHAFNEALPLTGVILTKTDGDARGGAALSLREITGKPIKFIGTGEKIDALGPFHPDRVASDILGMGDLLTLAEEAERKIDKEKAAKLAKKITKGKAFDLEDFRTQLEQMRQMGGAAHLISKIPGIKNLPQSVMRKIDDKAFRRMEVIMESMTSKERHFPDLIKNSQKRRIAEGSGTQIQDVNELLKQFKNMQKTMKKFSTPKMAKMMQKLKYAGIIPDDWSS